MSQDSYDLGLLQSREECLDGLDVARLEGAPWGFADGRPEGSDTWGCRQRFLGALPPRTEASRGGQQDPVELAADVPRREAAGAQCPAERDGLGHGNDKAVVPKRRSPRALNGRWR